MLITVMLITEDTLLKRALEASPHSSLAPVGGTTVTEAGGTVHDLSMVVQPVRPTPHSTTLSSEMLSPSHSLSLSGNVISP